jgi:hypothetical protein
MAITGIHGLKIALGATSAALGLMAAAPAWAQAAPAAEPVAAPTPTGAQGADDQAPPADIVVTGFRASLNSALGIKRRETATVDAIKAEDIAEFPDLNLAEFPAWRSAALTAKAATSRCAASGPIIRACGSTGWKRSAPPAAPTIRAASIAVADSISTSSRPTCSTA